MRRVIHFFAPGIPKPGGSKRAFFNRKTGRAMIVDACKDNKSWRENVAFAARSVFTGPVLREPLRVTMEFFMPRPKSHYGTGAKANVRKKNAPHRHTNRPDALKLARSTEDALTGIIWNDDCQTAELAIRKFYGDRPGCDITITTFAETVEEQIRDKCVHFTGIGNKTCKVGIHYDQFKKMGAFPCFRDSVNATCELRRWPTDEEVSAQVQRLKEAENRMMQTFEICTEIRREHKGKSWEGIVKCPLCGGKLHISHAGCNGHIHGFCETQNCVAWME